MAVQENFTVARPRDFNAMELDRFALEVDDKLRRIAEKLAKLEGQAGRTSKHEGTIDMQANRVTGLPPARALSDAVSLRDLQDKALVKDSFGIYQATGPIKLPLSNDGADPYSAISQNDLDSAIGSILRDRLITYSAAPSTLILSDDATDQTLTGSLGNLKIDSAGYIFPQVDIKTDYHLGYDTNTLLGIGVVGSGDLADDCTGAYAGYCGKYHTYIGFQAGYSTRYGFANVGVGYKSLYGIIDGDTNTALGYGSLRNLQDTDSNVGIGYAAGLNIIHGEENTLFGNSAMYSITGTASPVIGNCTIGHTTLMYVTAGNYNVALGDRAGKYLNGGSTPFTLVDNSIYIGAESCGSADGVSNEIAIGYQAIGKGSNTTAIGNSSTTDAYLYGNLHLGDDLLLEDSGTTYIRAGYDVTMIPYFETILPNPPFNITTTSIGNITASDGTAVVAQFGVTTLGAPLSTNAAGIILQETATTTPIFAMFDQSGNELCGYTGWSEEFFVSQNGTGTRALSVDGSTLETTFAEAYTFPVTDGTLNQVLTTDGSGNVDWATVSVLDTLDDLSDVGTVAYDAYKVLIADGTDTYNSGYLDRISDTDGNSSLIATHDASYLGLDTDNSGGIKTGESWGFGINPSSATKVYIQSSAINPGSSTYAMRAELLNGYYSGYYYSATLSGLRNVASINLVPASCTYEGKVSANVSRLGLTGSGTFGSGGDASVFSADVDISSGSTANYNIPIAAYTSLIQLKQTNSAADVAIFRGKANSYNVGGATIFATGIAEAQDARAGGFGSFSGWKSAGVYISSTGGVTNGVRHFEVVASSDDSPISTGVIGGDEVGLYVPALDNSFVTGSSWGIYNLSAHYAGDAIYFTQTDKMEYIDSLADGYMDYKATTSHRFGADSDSTNYAEIKADGEINLHGTARVTQSQWIAAGAIKAPGAKPATAIAHGTLESPAWQFANQAVAGNQETVSFSMKVPLDMDRTVAPSICVGWSTTTTGSNVEWQLEYLWLSEDEDSSAAAQATVTIIDANSGTAEGLVISHFPALAAPSATDICIHGRITRLSAGANDTTSDTLELQGIAMTYTADKLGEAT